MPAKIITDRVVKCSDTNCGKELPVGTEVLVYGKGKGIKYYGLICHTSSKEERGKKYMDAKWKAKAALQKRNVKEFVDALSRLCLTLDEAKELAEAMAHNTITKIDGGPEDWHRIKTKMLTFDEKSGVGRAWKEFEDWYQNGTILGEHWNLEEIKE